MRARGFMTGIANYQIYKAEIHYFYGDYEGASRFVRAQDRMIASAMSLPQLVRFYLVSSLTRAALFAQMEEAEQKEVLGRLTADLAQMTSWADHCPDNFLHLQHIMEGELARIGGHPMEALDHFEAAINAARKSEFRRDEALANELPARMLSAIGRPRAAEGYARAASYLYYRWGAVRKVTQLQEHFSGLLRAPATTKSVTMRSQSGGTSTWGEDMPIDMSSVVRASQAISSQLHLGQLWKTTMALLLENAGAQRGWFVVRQHGTLYIETYVEAGTDDTTLSEPVCVDSEDDNPLLPVSVINSVIRTREPIIIHDATEPGPFTADPYIQAHAPKSILCIPVQRHEQFAGALYMENTLTAGAFTEERVEVINLLSAQATISMENAKLYDEQVALIHAQQRFVPSQFLESLGHHDIARVGLGEYVSKEMSVMFSDLRGFTPMVERMGPGEVIEILNAYFSSLSTPIADAGGFIDSFNGDEIMALFGVSADDAVRAGVQMWRALETFNVASVASGGPALRMGMGMNTGPLVLGTVGGLNRLKCGVVGDTVNLASRIEQLTKVYGVPFLIGDGTHERLEHPERFAMRMVDRVSVKGKEQAVTLYEVIDANDARQNDAKRATRVLLDTAWAHYLARDFATASDALREAMNTDPADQVLALLHRRSERYRCSPPPEDWNGTENLQHK